ncbi:MAG: hypothetical protein ACRCZY_05840, partial [Phocaeicola sp.]
KKRTMKNNVYAVVENITPDVAREYLKFNNSNRPVRKQTVSFYEKEIRSGKWVLNGQGITFSDGGVLLDGQHRLHAIVKAGIPVQMMVVRNVCGDTFVTIDSGVSRSSSDVLALSNVKNSNSVSSIIKKYKLLVRECNIISFGGRQGGAKESNADVLVEYNLKKELYDEITTFAYSCYSKIKLFKVSEIGAICVFLISELHHDKDVTMNFFKMLCDQNCNENSNITILRNKLIQDKFGNNRMTFAYKQNILIKAWNYYISNKTVSVLSWNEAKEGKQSFL